MIYFGIKLYYPKYIMTGGELMKLDKMKLQILMAKKLVNISELADVSGLSANSISSFFSGRRSPSVKSLGKLAHGLGVDVTEIIED